jgi:hypothetical protein
VRYARQPGLPAGLAATSQPKVSASRKRQAVESPGLPGFPCLIPWDNELDQG